MHTKGFEPLRIAPIRPERITLTTRSRMHFKNLFPYKYTYLYKSN